MRDSTEGNAGRNCDPNRASVESERNATMCRISLFIDFKVKMKYFLQHLWRSGNRVGGMNEVTLRRARLVLGWVTCPGSTPRGGTLFRYVTSHPRPPQPFILSGSIN